MGKVRLVDAHDFWARLPRNAENITLADVMEALGGTPTIDAEPIRHGHYVKTHKTDKFAWECSECGCGFTDYKLTYCYDCGAKMDEV